MDHFVPATIAQNGLDFDRALAGDPFPVLLSAKAGAEEKSLEVVWTR